MSARDGTRTRFMFMYYGERINVSAFEDTLGLILAEGSMDVHKRHMTFFKTAIRLRASQVERAIREYNADVPISLHIHLTADPGAPTIVTGSKGSLKRYLIYKRICNDRHANVPEYWQWASDKGYDVAVSDNRQRNWFLTYNSKIELHAGILDEFGLVADQLVSSKDDGLHYLYFHLSRKVRRATVDLFLEMAAIKYGIKVNEIFGFDAINCASRGSSIDTHPGFWTLIKHDSDHNENFKIWMTGKGDVRKGYIRFKRAAAAGLVKLSCHGNEEFDVVKKRRGMDSALAEGETCPDALQRFEDFEASVSDALKLVSDECRKGRSEELLQMEQDYCNAVGPGMGFVYVAISEAINIPKIGATRRNDPSYRLRELSRHVPIPFNLVYSVPTLMPFKLESEVHAYFDAYRIREAGACTEFFNVELSAIGEFLRSKYEVVNEFCI